MRSAREAIILLNNGNGSLLDSSSRAFGGENLSKFRVLIVDDRQLVRQELRAFLPLAGSIEVVGEAADGLEAVRLVAALRPHAVLLDLQMPVMDGYQAAAQIKANCPSCRVVALTIHSDEIARQRAAEAGVDVFVLKGAPISELLEALDLHEEDSHGTES
jgi:DNA-binding NarL/FixJ family response regulator